MKLLYVVLVIVFSQHLTAAHSNSEIPAEHGSQSHENSINIKVGIIGGGSSGLYAGLLLDSLKIDYTIIEASETRLGGRIFTYKFDPYIPKESTSDCHQFMYTNLGAAFFSNGNFMKRITGDESWSLFNFLNKNVKEEYKLELIRAITSESNIVNSINGIAATTDDAQRNNDVYHLSRSNGGPVPDEYINLSTANLLFDPFLDVLQSLKNNFSAELLNVINKYDHLSVSQFLQQEDSYPEEVVDYIEKITCSSYSFTSSTVEMIIYLFSSYDIGDGLVKILGGSYNLIRAMASLLKGEVVRDVVTRVECNQNGKVIVTTKRGVQHVFDHLITTPTLKALNQIDFDSSCGITDEKMSAIRTAMYAPSTNIALKFNHKFWEDPDLMKGLPHYGGEAVTDLPIGIVIYNEAGVNCTASNGLKPGTIRLYSHGKGEFNGTIDTMLDDLEKIHGPLTRKYFSGEYFIQRWTSDHYILGGWAEFEPSFYSKYYKVLALPEFDGRIHIAGEGTSVFHGWILGGLNSAYRAVRNILKNVDPNSIANFESMWGPYNEPQF